MPKHRQFKLFIRKSRESGHWVMCCAVWFSGRWMPWTQAVTDTYADVPEAARECWQLAHERLHERVS